MNIFELINDHVGKMKTEGKSDEQTKNWLDETLSEIKDYPWEEFFTELEDAHLLDKYLNERNGS